MDLKGDNPGLNQYIITAYSSRESGKSLKKDLSQENWFPG
jgi:hypothetical protein